MNTRYPTSPFLPWSLLWRRPPPPNTSFDASVFGVRAYDQSAFVVAKDFEVDMVAPTSCIPEV